MEYAEHGCLREFLKKYKINNCSLPFTGQLLTSKDLVSFALQIARGMQHLAAHHCIHRDLAARNVLVTSDLRMKIADFGLSRTTGDSEYYRKISDYEVPVKWLAPECFNSSLYTAQSDVSLSGSGGAYTLPRYVDLICSPPANRSGLLASLSGRSPALATLRMRRWTCRICTPI